jgi:bifunctional non-homologous end joining protein LigD
LDGEIVAVDKQGRISFNLLQHHRSRAEALLFYAFDVLICRGTSLLKEPLHIRREVLERIFARGFTAPLSLPATLEASPADLIRAVREFGFEGIVAKRKDSLYESGKRSGARVKYKIHQGQEFGIGGYVPDHPFDSIIVGYYQEGKLYYAGKVRNGFVPHTRKEVFQRFKGLEIDACPFVNLPEKKRTMWALTREEMKNCVWVKPELVVRIEFGEWTPEVTCDIQSSLV